MQRTLLALGLCLLTLPLAACGGATQSTSQAAATASTDAQIASSKAALAEIKALVAKEPTATYDFTYSNNGADGHFAQKAGKVRFGVRSHDIFDGTTWYICLEDNSGSCQVDDRKTGSEVLGADGGSEAERKPDGLVGYEAKLSHPGIAKGTLLELHHETVAGVAATCLRATLGNNAPQDQCFSPEGVRISSTGMSITVTPKTYTTTVSDALFATS